MSLLYFTWEIAGQVLCRYILAAGGVSGAKRVQGSVSTNFRVSYSVCTYTLGSAAPTSPTTQLASVETHKTKVWRRGGEGKGTAHVHAHFFFARALSSSCCVSMVKLRRDPRVGRYPK